MKDDAEGSGGLDFGALLQQAQQMQEQLMAAQAAAADEVVEGRAGGGAVRVTVTGAMEFRSIRIDPDVVSASEVDMLEDLVLAAIRDATAKAAELSRDALGGLDLGGLRGLVEGT